MSEYRAAIAEWVRRHGVDPGTIPVQAQISRSPDGIWSVTDIDGHLITFREQEPFPTYRPRPVIIRVVP